MTKISSFIKKNSNRIIFVLSILGILLSMFLWLKQAGDGSVPCTIGGGCDVVLTSKWAKFYGVPLSVFGVFYYFQLAFISFLREKITNKLLNTLLDLMIVWGIIFSLYLRYLEFVKIGQHCIWCWVSVVFIVLITIVRLIERKSKK